MPYLILSDIHANREALDAVLEDSRKQNRRGYDAIVCLGDIVGYGADPSYVIAWAKKAQVAIRGNHDKACGGLDSLEDFNASARASSIWTRQALNEEELAYLRKQPRGPLRFAGFDLVHGSPRDEDEYVLDSEIAHSALDHLDSQVTFFGHTHVQGGFRIQFRGASIVKPAVALELEPNYFYLVNPGSVGQPRDQDPRAAYAVYHPEEKRVVFHRVAYDIQTASDKILKAGLPSNLSARLFHGR